MPYKRARQAWLVSRALDLEPFALSGPPVWFSRNEEIFGEGEPAEFLYKIKSGCIRTYRTLNDGRRQIDAFYIPGDVFGLEVRNFHNVSAEAVTRCKADIIARKALMARVGTEVAIANHLLALTGVELHRAQNHNLILLKGAHERMVCFLLDMAKRQNNSREIDLPMMRGDIADYLGLTTETVSRMLWKLESVSVISIPKRWRVIIRNMPMLQEFAG
jgi:CRP/FNR family transcriptional regulator, nitrogen fixation regulation protein